MNGVRLHYVIGGSGPAVMLVHGWPFTWREWRRTLPLLVEAGFTVIAPDLRGMGDSDKPETGYAKRSTAEDLHQLVNRIGLPEVNLVGTDIGTMVAHAYATAYPGEIGRLVLSEAMLPGFGLEEIMNVAAGGSWHFGFHMQVDIAEVLTAGKEAAYLRGMWDVMSHGGITEDDRTQLLRTYAGPRGMRGGFLHYVPLLDDGKANRAAATAPLPMPVLVLNGEHGLPRPPRHRCPATRRRRPGRHRPGQRPHDRRGQPPMARRPTQPLLRCRRRDRRLTTPAGVLSATGPLTRQAVP